MTQQLQRFAVVGAGGVGGYVGGLLADSGLDVTFVAKEPTAGVLRSRGLILRTVDNEIRIPSVRAVSSTQELRDVDVVILTTKSYDLPEVSRQFPDEIIRSSTIITFQNGIDSDRVVKEHAPNAEVYPGVAYIVSAKKEAGIIQQSAGPRKFIIGDRESADNEKLKKIALVMRDAGLAIEVSPDIERALWTKFIWILAFAGVTGACHSSIGPIVNDPGGFRMFERCVDEAIVVARGLGVQIDEAERQTVLDKAIGYRTKGTEAKSSLAVDLENKRPTEVEALHGVLVRMAREMDIDVPVTESMYNAIRFASR